MEGLTQTTTRRHHWKSPQSILGAVLLVIGLLTVAPQAWACLCKCYFSDECDEANGYKCDRKNCDHNKVNGKLKDGICRKPSSVSTQDQAVAAEALDSWLQAYAVAGATNGGEPDQRLIEEALSLPLTPQQHQDIRDLALNVVLDALGTTSYPDEFHAVGGLFSLPLVAQPVDCDNAETLDNGVIAPLDRTSLGVFNIIKDAVVGELRSPGMGILEEGLARIPEEYPDYTTYGVCEFPRVQGGATYPFADGLDCLNSEIRASVHSVLENAPLTYSFRSLAKGLNTP
jgi:hypothetical protein